jgi:tetratricopeptide (TPR) repeat protein
MKALALSLTVLLITACAQQERKLSMNDLTQEEIEKINREALVIISARLEKQISNLENADVERKTYFATDLFLKGNAALMEGDTVTAKELFKHLNTLVPNDDFLQKKYVYTLVKNNDFEDAKIVLEKIYKGSGEKDERYGLILAGVYSGLDMESESNNVYKKILSKNPGSKDACISLAKSYTTVKKFSEADSLLSRCQTNGKDKALFSFYKGKVAIDRGDLKLAEKYFYQAYKIDPGLKQAVSALGLMYEQKEQFKNASNVYAKYLEKDPQDEMILQKMVQSLFAQERYKDVVQYAERLVDLDSENLNLKIRLGILYSEAKQYEKALSVFSDILKVAPQSDRVLYYMAALYQETEQFVEALDYFSQIPPNSPLHQDSVLQMANILNDLAEKKGGEWDKKFITLINKSLNDYPSLKVELNVMMASYHESRDNFKSALINLEQVKDEKDFGTQHQYYLASLYEKEKMYKESTDIVMSMIAKDPKNAHAWNFMGFALLERGADHEEAFQYIQKAVSLKPHDGYIRDSLGWYHYKKGNMKEALKHLSYAAEKVPGDIAIIKHLATIHQNLKNYQKAKLYFEEALKHAKLESEKKEIFSVLEGLEANRKPASNP